MSAVRELDDIVSLHDQFELFLFDQFGVLHNGVTPYPGMQHVLQQLKQLNKHVVVISNSGKRASLNATRLSTFGYGPELVDRVYTSGELAWSRLSARLQTNTGSEKLKIFYLGNDGDRSAIAGLAVEETDVPKLADLIVIGGMGTDVLAEADYADLLRPAASKKIQAYCINPDTRSLYKDGRIGIGPGVIAHIYQELGGPCDYFGKPHPEIYLQIMSDYNLPAENCLCIGDSLDHDIQGAVSAGCQSVLVQTGIYQNLDKTAFLDKINNAVVKPDYLLAR